MANEENQAKCKLILNAIRYLHDDFEMFLCFPVECVWLVTHVTIMYGIFDGRLWTTKFEKISAWIVTYKS